MQLLSIKEAAKIIPNAITGELGISAGRVKHMIRDGLLPAKKIGSQWVIDKRSITKLYNRHNGRPKKLDK